MSNENDERERRFVAPFPGAAFSLAEKAGVGVRSALLWKAARFGTAGTGRRIIELSGSARTRAALAAVGKGPLNNGGRGMAGGAKTLGKIEVAVSFTLAAAYIGAVLVANRDNLATQPAPAVGVCENCQGELTVVPVAGENTDSVAVCPLCGHGGTSKA